MLSRLRFKMQKRSRLFAFIDFHSQSSLRPLGSMSREGCCLLKGRESLIKGEGVAKFGTQRRIETQLNLFAIA